MQHNKKYDHTQAKKINQLQSSASLLLIVKIIRIVYKNISDGYFVFIEQLFEVGESFWKNSQTKLVLEQNDCWVNLLLIVKTIRIVYKNISNGNLVFIEQLFEVGESF